jgi:hypothetical protein
VLDCCLIHHYSALRVKIFFLDLVWTVRSAQVAETIAGFSRLPVSLAMCAERRENFVSGGKCGDPISDPLLSTHTSGSFRQPWMGEASMGGVRSGLLAGLIVTRFVRGNSTKSRQ